jgi:TonB family protein
MELTKEKIYGLMGSGIFCFLIILILFLIVLRAEVKAGEEGVLVNFGTVDMSSGSFTPKQTVQPVPAPQPEQRPTQPPVSKPKVKPNTPPITQNTEETAAIDAAKQKQKEQDRLEAERIKAEKAKAEKEQQKRDAINRQVSGAFGPGNSDQSQQGTGQTGTGVQGNPQSTSPTGSPTGGGYGEFNLNGRTLGSGGLPKPAYSALEEGRIVIAITVDPKGNVLFAEINKGTNIDNSSMRKSALEAARKAKFNTISGSDNQTGTITYRYFLK